MWRNRKMSDIYIHIGTHKTGTTTIQQALRSIPKTTRKKEGWQRIGMPETAGQLQQSERYDKPLVAQLRRELDKSIRKNVGHRADNVILSSESLSGFPVRGYVNNAPVCAMLRDATEHLNVKIIIYLRRQDSFVESMYTQMIHEGLNLSFPEFLKNFDTSDALDYDRMLSNLRNYFGDRNVIVKSYHAAASQGLLKDFGKIINSPSLKALNLNDNNPSYSRKALEIARTCNPFLDKEERVILRRALQATMPKGRGIPFGFFTIEERMIFLRRYQLSNQKVAKRYFLGNLEKLFPIPASAAPAPYQEPLSYENIAKLITQLFHQGQLSSPPSRQNKLPHKAADILCRVFLHKNRQT
jgi:hypothetical protein